RSTAVSWNTPEERLELAAEPDQGGARSLQPRARGRPRERSAARGDDVPLPRRGLARGLGLALAKGGLALGLEQRRHALARAPLDPLLQVEEGIAAVGGGQRSPRGLAAAHEAHEHDALGGHRVAAATMEGNSGNETSTHSAPSISVSPSAASPATASAMAMRWS